jgi:hypothetical protein
MSASPRPATRSRSSLREPDGGKERRRHQVGRFRNVRDRGRTLGPRGRADRRHRKRLQQGHGGRRGKDSPIASIKDLKGKRVAIWPGSTQEVFILERLRMEGMSIKDISPVRVSFSEMHLALARGDVDAYVGAEPGPGVSLSTGSARSSSTRTAPPWGR